MRLTKGVLVHRMQCATQVNVAFPLVYTKMVKKKSPTRPVTQNVCTMFLFLCLLATFSSALREKRQYLISFHFANELGHQKTVVLYWIVLCKVKLISCANHKISKTNFCPFFISHVFENNIIIRAVVLFNWFYATHESSHKSKQNNLC